MTKSQIAASTVGAVLIPTFDFLYGEADAVVTIHGRAFILYYHGLVIWDQGRQEG